MATSFKLHICDADGIFFDGDAESVVVPSSDGLVGIMARHRNEVFSVEPGPFKYKTPDGVEHHAFVSSGMMRIEDGDVLLLVEDAERPEDIDEDLARREEEAAREAMLQKQSARDHIMAEAALHRAINRQKVKRTFK